MAILTHLQRSDYVKRATIAQAALLSDPTLLMARKDGDIGGSRKTALRTILSDLAGGRCAHCRQPIRINVTATALDAVTAAHLIPPSMVGSTVVRYGAVAWNLVALCRGCVNMSNRASEDGSVWVWSPDTLDAECILTVFPSLPKSKGPKDVERSTIDPVAWMTECERVALARGNVM